MVAESFNTAVINLRALQNNYRVIQQTVGNQVRVLSMIKSDAYGHGMIQSAKALAKVGGDAYGVAEIDEAIALREAGIEGEIILFLGTNAYEEIIAYNLTPVVFDMGVLADLSACAVKHDVQVGVHLKFDTGMGRIGIMPDEVLLFVRTINELPGVRLSGILSHFPMADQEDSLAITLAQNAEFDKVLSTMQNDFQIDSESLSMIHIANSAAINRCPDSYHNMVRPGISLYGCYPSDTEHRMRQASLESVMSFHTKVIQVKEVPANYGLSYGHLFTTKRPTRLAVLPVGYADGYLRVLTGRAHVLIKGQKAPVCGRICMNACVADITDIAGVEVFDDVVLMGRQQKDSGQDSGFSGAEISAADVAGWMETIHYEVLCLFGNSNQRKYID